jgi:lipopolysaccharide export system permease protein
MFIFLLQFVMKFIDQLVGKGLTAWLIMELVALNLSWMLVLAVPMSVLVATLMAFGELSSTNEITAMKAGGVSIYRMMAPVLFAGVLIGLVMVWFNNDVLPESNHRLKALTTDIRRKKPTIALVDGVFSQDIPGYSLLVRKASPTGDLAGITLYDFTNPSRNTVITASHGTITLSPDYRKILLNLREGEIHELDMQDMNAYRRVRFARHRIAMDVEGFDFERSAASAFTRGDRELSAPAMLLVADSLDNVRRGQTAELCDLMTKEMEGTLKGIWDTGSIPPAFTGSYAPTSALVKARTLGSVVATYIFRNEALERQASQYWVEINKKYSIPAACVVFVLVGLPLGVMARRGGFGIAATLSLGFFVLYWAFLIGGEKLADRDILSPFVGMWAANVIIGIMGIYLTFRTGRETLVIDWSFFQRFVPRRLRNVLPDEPPRDAVAR